VTGLNLLRLLVGWSTHQGLTLVHFSAQRESILTLELCVITQRIAQKVLTSSRKVDEPCLLVQNRIAEFHTELELIPAAVGPCQTVLELSGGRRFTQ